VADLHALVPQFEDRHAAGAAKVEAERRLKRLTDHQHDGGFFLKDGDPRVVAARENLARLTDEAARINDRYETRSGAWQSASQTQSAVETWLRDGRPHGTVLEDDDEFKVPMVVKGESITAGIERIRRRVRELRADLNRIRSAPYPASYCKAQARAQIEALAQRGAVNVSRLVEHDGDLEFPTQQVQVAIPPPAVVGFATVIDTVALVAWLHHDMLIGALDREIDAEADDDAALSHEVREQREAEVMGDILEQDRTEAALVWQAQAQGLPIEHRADCSPIALLGVVLVTAAPADRPGASSQWSWLSSVTGSR
jgi:hypothetical protein